MDMTSAEMSGAEVELSNRLGHMACSLAAGASMKFDFMVDVLLMVFYCRGEGNGTATIFSASTADSGMSPEWANAVRLVTEEHSAPKDENGNWITKQAGVGRNYDIASNSVVAMGIAFRRELKKIAGEGNHAILVMVRGQESRFKPHTWTAFCTDIEAGDEGAYEMLRHTAGVMEKLAPGMVHNHSGTRH